MNEKNQLLSAIKKYDFAIKELTLYLDTHPKCRRALALFNQYKTKRENAMNEYVSKYGAITVLQNNERWSWTDDPFPWEGR